MPQTFKDRLKILMKGERPYTWANLIGIERGLFQYYWQKGKIPTYENLMKIRNFTGCSLDWLLTGEVPVGGELIGLMRVKVSAKEDVKNRRLAGAIRTVKRIYQTGISDADLDAIENVLRHYLPRGR